MPTVPTEVNDRPGSASRGLALRRSPSWSEIVTACGLTALSGQSSSGREIDTVASRIPVPSGTSVHSASSGSHCPSSPRRSRAPSGGPVTTGTGSKGIEVILFFLPPMCSHAVSERPSSTRPGS